MPVMTYPISPGSLSKSHRSEANASENTPTHCLEADAMFEVALGLGGVPFEFVFVHSVRPARSFVKSGVNPHAHRLSLSCPKGARDLHKREGQFADVTRKLLSFGRD
jgi:hypothetical protein